MKDIEIINIDYTGKDPKYQCTDTRNMEDISIPFIVLDYAPFYTRNCVVKGDGNPLIKGKDYYFEDHLTNLQELTGRTVCCTIRLSTEACNTYKKITVDYQKVGDPVIPRSFLFDALEKIVDSDNKIDWNEQVHGKPDTYYPAYHKHDISSVEEMVGFGDIIILLKQAQGQVVKHGLDIYNSLNKIRDVCYEELDNIYKLKWKKMFGHITNVNNPHKVNKEDIGLGKHPNYDTATVEEDIEGIRDDVISTPRGVSKALENYDVDSDGYIKQGSLPFSYYGTGIYIPPPISGSFEGLGTNNASSAFCLEPNGWVVCLCRGFDTKVKNLYFYYNKDIKKNPNDFIFSGKQYNHPRLTADNVNVNHVVGGSNGLVLCIGDIETKKYYITLGNGTLDPNSHDLKLIDTSVFNDPIEGNVFDPYRSAVMLIGDWVYFIAQTNKWPKNKPDSEKWCPDMANYRMRIFYRIPKSDLTDKSKTTVQFVKQKMNYQDCNGNWHYNQNTVDFFVDVIGTRSNGERYLQSLGFDWDVSFPRIYPSPYHCQWVYKEDPSNKNLAIVRMLHGVQFYYWGVRSVGTNKHFALPLYFDTSNNTISLDPRWYKIRYNVETDVWTPPQGRDYLEWYNDFINLLVANHDEVTCSWLNNIGYISLGGDVFSLPYKLSVAFMGNKNNPNANQLDLFNKDFTGDLEHYHLNIPTDSPFGFCMALSTQADVWDYNGKLQQYPLEIFLSKNRNGTKQAFYRLAESTDYVASSKFDFKYIDRTVIGREPNSSFGKVYVKGMEDNETASAYLPVAFINRRRVNNRQYGMFRISSKFMNGNYPSVNSPLYNLRVHKAFDVAMDENGGFYLDTIATHIVNEEKGQVIIDPYTPGRRYINKAFWYGLLDTLLGGQKNNVKGSNGESKNGEYVLTVFIPTEENNTGKIPCIAFCYWHLYNDSQNTHMSYCHFNWISNGEHDGCKIPQFRDIRYPIQQYGGNGDGGAIATSNLEFDKDKHWTNINFNYDFPSVTPTLMFNPVDNADIDHQEYWFGSGIQHYTAGGAATAFVSFMNNTYDAGFRATYTLHGMPDTYQNVYNKGIRKVVNGMTSGGAGLYTEIDSNTYCLLQAVFIEGNWTLFINSDMTAIFNGSEKQLKKTNYDLSKLGIDQRNKTFYLYAVSGKGEGFYDLTLAQRTASPYHLLVATIRTNAFGIELIDVDQNFAISGFTISTSRRGGIVPASSGTQVESGSFKTVSYEDLFNTSTYN